MGRTYTWDYKEDQWVGHTPGITKIIKGWDTYLGIPRISMGGGHTPGITKNTHRWDTYLGIPRISMCRTYIWEYRECKWVGNTSGITENVNG